MEILNDNEKKQRAIDIMNAHIKCRIPQLNKLDDKSMQEHFEWLESITLRLDWEKQFCRSTLAKKGLIKYSDSIPKTGNLTLTPAERPKKGRPKGSGEVKVKLSPFEKAVQGLIDLGLSKEDAIEATMKVQGK